MNDCWVEITFKDDGKEVYYLLNGVFYYNQNSENMYEYCTMSEVESISRKITELVYKEQS